MGTVNFTCDAREFPLPTLNWSATIQNNEMIHTFNERISIASYNTQFGIISFLTIQLVHLEDEGSYICAKMFGEQIVMLTVYDLTVGKLLL